MAGIHPRGGFGQVTALVLAHLAFQRPLHLGDLVPGVQPAAVGNIAGIQLGQAFIRVIADRYAGIERVKVVAAVPAAQAGAGAVTGGGFKILVPLTVLHHSTAAMVNPALPHRMGGAGTLVGGHLHKLAVHLFHAGQLQFRTGLVCAGQHGPAGGHFQRVSVAAGVGDVRHGVRQVIHRAADGGAVIQGSGADQPPRAGKPVLKRAGHRVGGGGRQVLPGAAGLAVPGIQQVQQGRGLVDRRRVQPRSRIHSIVRSQGLCPGGFQQPLDLRPAFAGVPGQGGNGVAAHRAGFGQPPCLPYGRWGQRVQLAQAFHAPGNVLQNVIFHLLPQLHKTAGQGFQLVRGQHGASPHGAKVRASSALFSALVSAAIWAASSWL